MRLQEKIIEEQQTVVAQNIAEFFRYTREYLANVRESVNQRNFVCNEYYRHKIALNEKKNKKLLLDSRLWEVEPETAKGLELEPEGVRADPEIARRLFFPEVG